MSTVVSSGKAVAASPKDAEARDGGWVTL